MPDLERTVNRWGLGEQLKLACPDFKVIARRDYRSLPPSVRVLHGRSLSPAAAVALADGLRDAAEWAAGGLHETTIEHDTRYHQGGEVEVARALCLDCDWGSDWGDDADVRDEAAMHADPLTRGDQ